MGRVYLANFRVVFVFAWMIKVYCSVREVRPLEKAKFRKSRARQSFRAATTKLGSRYPTAFQNQVSTAPGLFCHCELFSAPSSLPESLLFLPVSSSWLLQPHGFSIFGVFKIPRQKNHRNIGKYRGEQASKYYKSHSILLNI
ncbi:hypothetical protein H1C71_011317 [Ictidomys tridecemlineatus]|nr:hypothetical protein H1C71_011317 [Ictidomys tridecemlineatus]